MLLAPLGAIAGVLSGLLGIGGGVVMVPALMTVGRLDPHRAHAASLAATVPIALLGAALYAIGGEIDFLAAGLLVAGSLAGVRAGTSVMQRMDAVWLTRAFALLLLAVAVTMLL